jgi:hypothetical protein
VDPIDALRLIAARAPSISGEAAKALRVTVPSPQRLSAIAMHALRDPEAAWTTEERAALVALIAPVERETRSERVYLRLTPTESADLQERADAETNGDRSEYVRRVLFRS